MPSKAPAADIAAQERATQLYDEGARILDELWDDDLGMVRYDSERAVLHDARSTLAYAGVLLQRGAEDDVARAARAIAKVLGMQETREDDAHCGNFRWFYEDEVMSDVNGVEFSLDALNFIMRAYGSKLPDAAAEAIRRAIALGLDEIERLDVHVSYTNIALSDICNSILGGELLGDVRFVERGARVLDEWFEFTSRSGAPHEFNSPTYLAVDIERMAFLAEHSQNPDIRLKARVAEERLWLHVAMHYHPSLAQLAGPHSRAYFDGWAGCGGYLKLLLWRVLGDEKLRVPTPYFVAGREEGHTTVALDVLHCPAYIVQLLRAKTYPFAARETTDVVRGVDITTYMTDAYALGSASKTYTVGVRPEIWPGFNSLLLHARRDSENFATLYARYIIDDRYDGAIVRGSNQRAEDQWDEGQFVAAQCENRAIVAYGLLPRLRPTRSGKLSVRMLGVDSGDAIWAGDQRITEFPARVLPGDAVVIDAGETYVAAIPLEPTEMGSQAGIELNLNGALLSLDLYNYRGPGKQFWEHRSQGGPFYRGNVRNAFILEVARADEFESISAFRDHIAGGRVVDTVGDDLVREIAYASGERSLSLRYSLLDMGVIRRTADDTVLAAPASRGGAMDGTGLQFVQSSESIVRLGVACLLSGTTAKWIASDSDNGRYVFINPTEEATPFCLETAQSVVECDSLGFARISVDEHAGVVDLEATGEIAPVRLGGETLQRLLLNGVDVTDQVVLNEDGMREFAGAS